MNRLPFKITRNLILEIEAGCTLALAGIFLWQGIVHIQGLIIIAGLLLLQSVAYVLCHFGSVCYRITAVTEVILAPSTVLMLLGLRSVELGLAIKIAAPIVFGVVLLAAIAFKLAHKRSQFYGDNVLFDISVIAAFITLALTIFSIFREPSREETEVILSIIKTAVAMTTLFGSFFFSVGLLIISFAKSDLTLKEKISTMLDFAKKYHLTFILSELFTLVLAIMCVVNSPKADYYAYLSTFYFFIFTVKLVTYVWALILEKNIKDEKKLSKRKNIILIVNSIVFMVSMEIIYSGLTNISAAKLNSTMPFWLFVIVMFPYSAYSFAHAIMARVVGKGKDDAYFEVSSDQALISSVFSFFGGVSFFLQYIPDEGIRSTVWFVLLMAIVITAPVLLLLSLIRGIQGARGRRAVQMR